MAIKSKKFNFRILRAVAFLLALVFTAGWSAALWELCSFAVSAGYYGSENIEESLNNFLFTSRFLDETGFVCYAVKRVYVTYEGGEAFESGQLERVLNRRREENVKSQAQALSESYRREADAFNKAKVEGVVTGTRGYVDEGGIVKSDNIYEGGYCLSDFRNADGYIINSDGTVSVDESYFYNIALAHYSEGAVTVEQCRRQYDNLTEYLSTVKSLQYMLVSYSGRVYTNSSCASPEDFILKADGKWCFYTHDDFGNLTLSPEFANLSARTAPDNSIEAGIQSSAGARVVPSDYIRRFLSSVSRGSQEKLKNPDYLVGSELEDSEMPYSLYVYYDSSLGDSIDPFFALEDEHHRAVSVLSFNTVMFIISLLVSLVSGVFIVAAAGKQTPGGAVVTRPVDRMFAELFFVISAGLLWAIALGVYSTVDHGIIGADNYSWLYRMGFVALFELSVMVIIGFFSSMVRRVRARAFLRSTLIAYPFNLISKLHGNNSNLPDGVKRQFRLILPIFIFGIAAGTVTAVFGAYLRNPLVIVIGLALLVIVLSAGISAVYNYAKSLDIIRQAVEQAHRGNYSIQYSTEKMPATMNQLAQRISTLREGFRLAVEAAVRDQKTKTELITNVSHDLKTPLTSIINYSDLLVRLHIENEQANEFAGIINEKSLRLKQLIEDLIEASKASSGNVKFDYADIDLGELVLQVLAENDEMLENAHIETAVSDDGTEPIVRADGGKTCRIVENLLSNIAKYARSDTQAKIRIFTRDGFGCAEFENVSKASLEGMDPRELIERFVRGDSSRSGEGTGLGLSIASDFCKLQGGRFSIRFEEGNFIAAVSLPLAEDKPEANN